MILVQDGIWTEDSVTSLISHRQVLRLNGEESEAPYIIDKTVTVTIVSCMLSGMFIIFLILSIMNA